MLSILTLHMDKSSSLRKQSLFWEYFFAVTPENGQSSSVSSSYLRKLLVDAAPWLGLAHDSEYFVALQGGEPVARLSVNRTLHDKKLGYFGCFDHRLDNSNSGSEAMRILLKQAETWANSRGIETLLGPVTLATWFPYRMQVEEFAEAAFFWEPQNPLVYSQVLNTAGFRVAHEYATYCTEGFSQALSRSEQHLIRSTEAGFTFKRLGTAEMFSSLETLYKLTIDTFDQNFLFEPIPFDAFSKLYLAGQRLNNNETIIDCVYSPEGIPAGFMLSLIERGHLVLKTMGIQQPFRRHGLAYALAARALQRATSENCWGLVGALVHTSGASQKWWDELTRESIKLWKHSYFLFEKKISEKCQGAPQ